MNGSCGTGASHNRRAASSAASTRPPTTARFQVSRFKQTFLYGGNRVAQMADDIREPTKIAFQRPHVRLDLGQIVLDLVDFFSGWLIWCVHGLMKGFAVTDALLPGPPPTPEQMAAFRRCCAYVYTMIDGSPELTEQEQIKLPDAWEVKGEMLSDEEVETIIGRSRRPDLAAQSDTE